MAVAGVKPAGLFRINAVGEKENNDKAAESDSQYVTAR